MKRTKIVCTLGPATADREKMRELALAGMDVARLNFSHGTHEWHAERFRLIRELEPELGRPISVLQDLSGPKLRIGEVAPEGVPLVPGDRCILWERAYEAGPPPRVPLPIPELVLALEPGHHVFLDDGQIELLVVEEKEHEVACEVLHGGVLMSRKGITAPAAPFQIPALTTKDYLDLDFGLKLGVDWVAVSFVRKAADLEPVRAAARKAGLDVGVIAKIEKPEAVEAIDEILTAADGLMIARGDLGVEIPIYQVPTVQKDLIRRCVEQGKPVITATQMLESMTRSPQPTRAEVSDVANAIMDGTSAVMLSGETAVGQYPVQAVKMMAAVAGWTEQHLEYRRFLAQGLSGQAAGITDAISQGVAEIASDLNAAAILCSTTSGQTARMVSRMRPRMPIIAATANLRTYHRLPLVWGVRQLLVPPTTNTDEMLAATVRGALQAGWIEPGQTVVIASGVPVGTPGHTNLIKVQRVDQD
jgi:pyruvate kinase